MYTMFVVNSVFFFQSSLITRDNAPRTVSGEKEIVCSEFVQLLVQGYGFEAFQGLTCCTVFFGHLRKFLILISIPTCTCE